MKAGTRSLLMGTHQVVVHPTLVAWGWWKNFGWPKDLRLWMTFLVHDWGYWGKPNLDGKEGERHPEVGAKIMASCFGKEWGEFTLLHSRAYSRRKGDAVSALGVADKRALVLTPEWLFLGLARLGGEMGEYMQGQDGRAAGGDGRDWLKVIKQQTKEWIEQEGQDGRLVGQPRRRRRHRPIGLGE